MNRLPITILAILLCLLSTAFLTNTAFAQDQDKPLLSEAIREAIDSRGVEAAKEHFLGMDHSQRDQYDIDMEGISELTNSYVEDGNLEALAAIGEISASFMQDMISESMNELSPEMTKMMAEQRQADKEQQAKQREEDRERRLQERIVESQGQPRNDLERFTGLYADPDTEDSTRRLWVTASCDGYLVSGAMWGDAAPWWLRSESDNVFTYEDSFNNLRMEFTTDADGRAVEMIHDLDFLVSPLERVAPLPDDRDSCLERIQW